MNLQKKKPIIFTALSKKYFYMRMLIVKYVLENESVPINPFMSFDYYLADTVERNIIRNANNNLVALADELWVFGSISNGVMAEIRQVQNMKKPIRFFTIENDQDITEISRDRLVFEDGMEAFKKELKNL
ncbi:MAG: hypothetical protein WAU31_00790 [Candidatus Moraniibacteriota bacterium]